MEFPAKQAPGLHLSARNGRNSQFRRLHESTEFLQCLLSLSQRTKTDYLSRHPVGCQHARRKVFLRAALSQGKG